MAGLPLARWIAADEVATDERGWAFDLAVFRVVVLGLAVLPFAWRALAWTASVLPALSADVWVPVSFFAWLPREVVADARLAWWLALANVACVGLGLAGVRTGTTLGAATLLSLYVFGLMENAGKVDHYHHLIWFMALLAVGPSARFLAVDAILAARGRDAGGDPPTGALTTLRAVWLLLGLVYLGPGLAKLAAAIGDGWAAPEHLRLLIGWQWFARTLYQPGFEPMRWVEGLPSALLAFGGVTVIGFEVAFVGLVLFRRARPFLCVAGLAFHVVNGLVLGIWFAFLLPAYVALIDWAALARRFGVEVAGGRAVAARVPATSRCGAVALVGALLLVAEAGVSAGRLLRPQWRGPVWPFDLYPTFASPRSPDATVWEPRIVRADGREVRLGPGAWARAFGSAARCRRVAEGLRGESDPVRRRVRSRAVLALLWRHEAPEARAGAVAIGVYEVRYAVATPATPLAETLLDRFEIAEIASG